MIALITDVQLILYGQSHLTFSTKDDWLLALHHSASALRIRTCPFGPSRWQWDGVLQDHNLTYSCYLHRLVAFVAKLGATTVTLNTLNKVRCVLNLLSIFCIVHHMGTLPNRTVQSLKPDVHNIWF